MSTDRAHLPHGCSASPTMVLSSVAGPEPFAVMVEEPDPAVVVVSVVGEVDKLTEAPLHDHISSVLATRPARLIIDLGGVSFLGAAGLSVLISARNTAARQGTTLQLRPPHRPVVAQALEITGLDCLFEILPPVTGTDETQSHRVEDVSHAGEADQDEYAAMAVLQRRYAELASDDPERQRLRDAVIRGYLPVAAHIARRFAGRGEPLEDLIQVATMGLVNAVDRFEPARGLHFLSFAVPTITGELRRYFRDHAWSTRVPRRLKDLSLAIRGARAELSQQLGRSPRPTEIAERLGLPTSKVLEALHAGEAYRSSSLDQMLTCGDTTAPYLCELDPDMNLIEDRETLRPLLAELAPRQRTILMLRFFHQLTQSQIAEQVGISQMHVSRLLRQTLTFLRERMTATDDPACAADRQDGSRQGWDMDAIALLREDHIKVLTLLDELEAKSRSAPLKDSADLKRLVTELVMAESAHEAIEEQFFWPSVQHWLKEGRQLAAPALQQEQAAKHVLQELDKLAPGDPGFETLLARVISDAREHIAYEEHEVWPRAQRIARSELEQIGKKMGSSILGGHRRVPR